MNKFEHIKKFAEGKSDSEKMMIYEQHKKSEALAIILSFFIPGLGQIVMGETGKGVLMLILAIVGAVLTTACIGVLIYIPVWIWSIVDAYNLVKEYNLQLYSTIFEKND